MKSVSNLLSCQNFRNILTSLVARNLRIKYKGSALGVLWFFIEPVLTMVILYFVFSRVMKIRMEKYPFFLLTAILPWTFFARAITEATTSIIDNANLVKNVNFPREALPLSSVLSNFVCFMAGFFVLVPVLIFFKVPINASIVFLPVVLLLHLVFTAGLGLLTGCLNVYLVDINHFIRYVLMLWFYLSPVFYTLSMVPYHLQRIYRLNPMVSILTMYRNVLFDGKAPVFSDILISFAAAVIAAAVGYAVFRKYQSGFAKEI